MCVFVGLLFAGCTEVTFVLKLECNIGFRFSSCDRARIVRLARLLRASSALRERLVQVSCRDVFENCREQHLLPPGKGQKASQRSIRGSGNGLASYLRVAVREFWTRSLRGITKLVNENQQAG